VATHKSAIKRARQAEKRRERNRAAISAMKTHIKKVHSAILAGRESGELNKTLREAVSYIDKIAEKGIIHKNKARRLISRLTIKVNKTSP